MNAFPVVDMVATGDNIRMMRERVGMTVADLQRVFGFTSTVAIYKWQRGDSLPTIDNLVVLAAVFGVSISDIIICRTQAIA